LDADLDLATGNVDRGLLGLDRLRQSRVDQAEGDAIDIDLVASPFLAERACEADQRGFRGGIAVGNIGEKLLWRLPGGMPTDWVVKSETSLISRQQRELVEEKLRSRLGINVESIRGAHGKPDRIDTFNGNYGLNRGLAAACFVLACVAVTQKSWPACVLLAGLTAVYAFQAYRFGVYYARELYLQFLTITEGMASSPSD
jgi:hypothetical protein